MRRTKQRQKSFPLRIMQKRRVKLPSRIPGLAVGEVAQTQDGPMKKVCFNIGGKWIFRMVETDWVPPGRPHGRAQRKAGLNLHKPKRASQRALKMQEEKPLKGKTAS